MGWFLVGVFFVGTALLSQAASRFWRVLGVLITLACLGLIAAGCFADYRMSERVSGSITAGDTKIYAGDPITVTVTIDNQTSVDIEQVYISVRGSLATKGCAIEATHPLANREAGPIILGVVVPMPIGSLGRTLVFSGPTAQTLVVYQLRLIGIEPGEYNSGVQLAFERIGFEPLGPLIFEETDLKVIVLPNTTASSCADLDALR